MVLNITNPKVVINQFIPEPYLHIFYFVRTAVYNPERPKPLPTNGSHEKPAEVTKIFRIWISFLLVMSGVYATPDVACSNGAVIANRSDGCHDNCNAVDIFILKAMPVSRDTASSPPCQSIHPSTFTGTNSHPSITDLRYGIQTLPKRSTATSLSVMLVMYMKAFSFACSM